MVVVQSAIEVRELGQRAKSGVVTLQDVTLAIEPGELVAIIGGSGSGKTTLLDAMCGLRPPAAGTVNLISGKIGYVPQDDVIHLTLPLARTLRYAAALRAVPSSSVGTVLRALELTGRSLVPVGQLSGGERKRASIASELLAGPTLFFLDEPTSGLDPARGAELMRALRGLAEAGTTVVVTTHNPSDADRCDKVAVLAPGGRLAFFGTPAEARLHFGTSTLEEIYELLDGTGDPDGPAVTIVYPEERPRPGPASPPAAGSGPAGRPAGRSGSGCCSPGATPTCSPAARSPSRSSSGPRSWCSLCSWCCSARARSTRPSRVRRRP